MNDHAGAIDRANLREGRRQFHGVKGLPDKINHLTALVAKEMMMSRAQRLVTRLVLRCFQTVGQMELFKGGKGSIDGVKRQRREPAGQEFVEGFRGRMIPGFQQRSVDFQALLGDFETSGFAGMFKVLKLLLRIVGCHKRN